MARRRSKRKMPPLHEGPLERLEEGGKVEDGVLTQYRARILAKFIAKGEIDKIEFKLARGKESDIFVVKKGPSIDIEDEYLIIKAYRIERSEFFKSIRQYIVSDPRFSVVKSRYRLIDMWCKKEYGNLKVAEVAGIYAPKPFAARGNFLLMQYIHDDNMDPAPQLKDYRLSKPDETFNIIIDQIKKLVRAQLVHADLSPYNIIIKKDYNKELPYFIDFGQAVSIQHLRALEFLNRDIDNIYSYFVHEYKIDLDIDKIKNDIDKIFIEELNA
ncbi:MAG: RIO-type serine/threonine-protein kinase Rio1 [Candidatus Micrarchaeota archaeon]|nr:MAG: RIO-type serine/threonine-protein kinase Rio1 [Candidatus Micrarchaeota archaeon]